MRRLITLLFAIMTVTLCVAQSAVIRPGGSKPAASAAKTKPSYSGAKTSGAKPAARKRTTTAAPKTKTSATARHRQNTPQSEFEMNLAQARNGNVESQYYVAESYADGENGVQKDADQAKYWYSKAAEQGHVESMSCLGDIYYDDSNYNRAYYWYEQAAELGDVSAIESLGEMYLYGRGVDTDYDMAAKYLKRAALKNDVFGMYYYGYCLYYGAGVKKDVEQAQYYYEEVKNIVSKFDITLDPYSQMDPPAGLASDLVVYSITENPKVAKQHKTAKTATAILSNVALTDQFTLVEISYEVKKDSGVGLQSGTVLKSKNSQKTFAITAWGYKDSDGNYQQLEFDKFFNVEANGSYTLYMVFEPLDHETDNISIYENGKDDFFWEGVKLSPFNRNGIQ